MRYHLLLLFVLLLAGVCAFFPAHTLATPDRPVDTAPGEVLVKLQAGWQLSSSAAVTYTAQGVSAQSAAREARSLQRLFANQQVAQAEPLAPQSRTYRLTLGSRADSAQVAGTLAAHPAVEFAEPNYRYHAMRSPNDAFLGEQWALRNIQALEAWDITTGEGILVAVIDTGVMSKHTDLDGQVTAGYNAITGTADTEDDVGHGTAVAGLIAARTDNDQGIAGMCWGCTILPVRVLGSDGSGEAFALARGMRWATDAGARVINLSLGGRDNSQVVYEAVQYANSRGVLIVSASGNERQENNQVNYPAAYSEVVAVGGTGNTDQLTGFSNTGDHLDIAAPSVGLLTTIPGERQYGFPNGTSFSSPYVSGTAALVWTLRPDLSNLDVKCILEASADDQGTPGKDPEYGWGRLNAFRAVQLAQTYGGCPLNQAAAPPAPAPLPNAPTAFAPVPPVASTADQTYFPETQHTLRGAFKFYWETHGGLPIFGYPISEEFIERGADGRDYIVQYFERHRFEYHADNAPPYDVQLSRLGDLILQTQGRSWYTFPKGAPAPGCLFFEATGHTLCEPFLSVWQANGLEFDGRPGKSFEESLALFGQPLSQPQPEEVAPGVWVTVQWFERARFEDHGPNGVLLGLLSSELARSRGWR